MNMFDSVKIQNSEGLIKNNDPFHQTTESDHYNKLQKEVLGILNQDNKQ